MTRIHNVGTGAKTARGEHSRYLGKKHVAGRLADAKFYLGYDENDATMNRLRLEKLWSAILQDTPPIHTMNLGHPPLCFVSTHASPAA